MVRDTGDPSAALFPRPERPLSVPRMPLVLGSLLNRPTELLFLETYQFSLHLYLQRRAKPQNLIPSL